ncbi:dTDP-4-dehydrorhamnose reductase [Brevibacillus sp. H7]|uniref:dTDP-4-dehydrorhamnose reductase n=1 Tax=Brevibacillus sp. H7 TaxID=3349138 RepID=UPI003820A057
MKVLITGGKGQLGVDAASVFQQRGWEVFVFGRDRLDVTKGEQVMEVVESVRPDVVIHAAAYTQVDQAEQDVDSAYLVNAYGTRNVAVASEKVKAKLVYISTDYVFDGTGIDPYNEFAPTNPQSVYGKSKLAGESFVRELSSRFFIVRTSWVYGLYGNNFVKTMLKLAKERNELSVLYDQVGSPTYTVDLVCFLEELASTELYGTYHASNSGQCSWYEFAKAIFEEAGLNHVIVHPVTTEQLKRPAPRPAFSVMDHMSIRLNGLQHLRPWREALREFLEQLHDNGLDQ